MPVELTRSGQLHAEVLFFSQPFGRAAMKSDAGHHERARVSVMSL